MRCHDEAMTIAAHSGCPSSHWLDRVAPLLARGLGPAERINLVNVGANKGWRIAAFLQRYNGSTLSGGAWMEALRKATPPPCARGQPKTTGVCGGRLRYSCGMCLECKDAIATPAAARPQPVHAYAIEMQLANVAALRHVVSQLSLPASIHHAIVTNVSRHGTYSSSCWYRRTVHVGLEHMDVRAEGRLPPTTSADGLLKSAEGHTLLPATCISVDSFAVEHGLERIHHLLIDAEGYDPLVLEGAINMLSRRRVDVLEFEYVGKGRWRPDQPESRSLHAVIAQLEAFGYNCFWQGNGGRAPGQGQHRLAPVGATARTGWCESYNARDFHRRVAKSNLVCAHAPPVLAALRVLVPSALKGALS